MNEIITTLTDTLKSLPNWMKLVAIIAILGAGLAYTWISTPDEAEETPTTTTKSVEVGEVKTNGNIEGGINISQ